MNKKLTLKFGIFLLFGIMFLGIVSAFDGGINTPYMPEIEGIRVFEAYQDNSEDFVAHIQSSEENPINVRVDIIDGEEVIELIEPENIFLVSPNEKVPVRFRILAPKGAQIGDRYRVILSFSSSEVGEGALAFGQAFQRSFDVVLVEMPIFTKAEPEESENQLALLIFIGIILLLILIIVVLKVKRCKRVKALEKAKENPVKKKVAKKKSVNKKVVKKKNSAKKKTAKKK
jgi:hypothetical protein